MHKIPPPKNPKAMKMQKSSNTTFSKVFHERLSSLMEDGYCVRVKCHDKRIWFVRLKHMANGNTIILKGYPAKSTIEQYTNSICTYKETFE